MYPSAGSQWRRAPQASAGSGTIQKNGSTIAIQSAEYQRVFQGRSGRTP